MKRLLGGKRSVIGWFLVCLLSMASSRQAAGADYYWDTATSGGYQGGNGTWDISGAAYWSPAGGTALADWVNGAGNDAHLTATDAPSVIALGAVNITLGTLFVGDNTAFTLRQNAAADRTLTYTAIQSSASSGVQTLTLDAATGRSLALGSPIRNGGSGGTLALSKTGAGTLTLSGANEYTGTTAVSGGTMALAGTGGKLLGAGGVTIGGRGTLSYANGVDNRVNTDATLTLGGDIAGYTKIGAGTLLMLAPAAAATYSQTLASLTIRPGSNRIDPSGTTGTLYLIFTGTGGAGYQRDAGGLVSITTPSANWVPSWANAPTATGTSEVSGTGDDAILVGAFLALSRGTGEFVKADASFSQASYTDVVFGTDPDTWTSGKNIRMTTGGTTPRLDASLNVNSLIVAQPNNPPVASVMPIATGATLTIDSGMVYARNGSITFGSGTDLGSIASGNGQDLVLVAGRQGTSDLSLTVRSAVTGNPALTVNCEVRLTNGANAIGDVYLHRYYTSNAVSFDSQAQGALGQSGTDRTIFFLGSPTTDTVATLLKISTVAQTYDNSLKLHFGGEVGFVPIIQADTYAEFQGRLSGHNGFRLTGAGLLRLTNTANDFAGNVDVNAGALAIPNMNVLPATGNLAVSGGVLVLDGRGSGNDVIRPGDLPTYGTGAGQWQFTSGGFAARGADITIGSTGIGANFGFDRNFTLGSAARDAGGNYFANAGVTISQDINLTANRTITVAGTGAMYNGGVGNTATLAQYGSAVVYRISGNISGSGAPVFSSPAGGAGITTAEIVLGGTNTWTGSPDASAGNGGLAVLHPNNVVGRIVRFDGQQSLPDGNNSGASAAQIVAAVTGNNGGIVGLLFTGSGSGVTYTPNSNYRFLLGATDGNDRLTTIGSDGGAVTLSNSTLLLSSAGATNPKSTGLLVRDSGGTFQLGAGAGAAALIATSKPTTLITPTEDLSTLQNTTGARYLKKAGLGTVVIGNVVYQNTTGSGMADYSGGFTWQLGQGYQVSGANVFDGAVRETGSDATNSMVNNPARMQGGVLEFGATPRAITLGTAAGHVDMTGVGGGGFSAHGADRTVTVTNAAVLVWNTTTVGHASQYFVRAQPLIFGSTTANATAILANGINLNNAARTIATVRGAGARPEGEVAGVISSTTSASGRLVVGGLKRPDGTALPAGALVLSAANTYAGGTSVDAGTLLVNNASGSGTGPGDVTVKSGAALGGTGSIAGAVTVESGGALAPGAPTGMLTLNGDLGLSPGAVLAVEIAGEADADRLVMGGAANVSLDGATLVVSRGAYRPLSLRWFILTLDTGALTGQFAGLGEGAEVLVDGARWRITYQADAATGGLKGGNDVALHAAPGGTVLTAR